MIQRQNAFAPRLYQNKGEFLAISLTPNKIADNYLRPTVVFRESEVGAILICLKIFLFLQKNFGFIFLVFQFTLLF